MNKILVFCLVLLISLQLSAEEGGSRQIRLGATLPLTGDLATYGNLIKQGIDLAVSEFQKNGTDVQVVYEDIPAPTAAIAAIKKLIAEDKIHALAGNFWNPAIPIMAESLNRHQIPAFHTAAADDLILAAGDYVVSTNTKIKDEAYTIADYAYQTMGARTANVLYIATTFGENYQKHFIDRFTAQGGQIKMQEYIKLGDVDLKAILTKFRSKPADVFFLGCFGTNLGLVLKQARQVNLTQPVLSVYESEDPSVIDVAGQAAEGLKFFVPEADPTYPPYQEFRKIFQEKFKEEPRILAANSYDATRILVQSLVTCKLDTACVKDQIYLTKDYPGASGSFTIDQEGAAKKNFVLKTVQGGKFVRVE